MLTMKLHVPDLRLYCLFYLMSFLTFLLFLLFDDGIRINAYFVDVSVICHLQQFLQQNRKFSNNSIWKDLNERTDRLCGKYVARVRRVSSAQKVWRGKWSLGMAMKEMKFAYALQSEHAQYKRQQTWLTTLYPPASVWVVEPMTKLSSVLI